METSSTLDRQSSSSSKPASSAGDNAGLVPGLVGAGVDLAGSGVRTTFGLISEVRGQTFSMANQSIDFAEQIMRGLFDLSRRSAKRLDQAVGEVASAVERVAVSALGAVRTTSEQAAQVAMTVAENAVGSRRNSTN